MGRFYAKYLTHQPKADHATARGFYDKFKLALWARALGQPTLAPNGAWSQIARISSVDPFIKEIGRMGTMYLGGIKPGRLLDVGCGNGSFLELMRSVGWQIAGIEPDPKAAKLASERLRSPVRGGQLCDAGFEDGSFDAITLHHVIEHVHDPIGMMAECRRILRPGGHMVIVTPNLSSCGHRWFKGDWRGIEPPRHLHVFSSSALVAGAQRAGVQPKLIRASARAALFVWLESQDISRCRVEARKRQSSLTGGLAFLAWERAVTTLQPGLGEELVLVGTRAV
jgi:2-polyprenyl-3-methyl-5-hydroxy-6-metoxy-1,4-benzoquinol methylase